MKWDSRFFLKVTNIFKITVKENFYSTDNNPTDQAFIYKGIFFPTIVKDDTFKPITEWVHTTTAQATTKEMTLATIKESTLGTTPE
ncbi:hypothetical protein Bhyg_12432, partial [Pseudolycoriella hygida]